MAISSPLDIAGCQFWYDASQIVGLSDSDPVATWLDLSGNVRHLLQVTGGKQPLYRTGIVNGLPIIRFDGSNDNLAATGFTLNQPSTMVAVFVQRMDPAGNKGLMDGASADYSRYLFVAGSGNTLGLYAGTTLNGPALTVGTIYHTTAIFNGASSSVRINGGTATSGNAGSGGASGVTIGSSNNGAGGEYAQFDFGEVFGYNSALSAGNLTDIHTYLDAKWRGIGGGSSTVPRKMASYRRRRAA
jgi:hypothetical protein